MCDSGEFGESKEPSASPRNPVEAAARGGGGGGFSVFFDVRSGPGTPATDNVPVVSNCTPRHHQNEALPLPRVFRLTWSLGQDWPTR